MGMNIQRRMRFLLFCVLCACTVAPVFAAETKTETATFAGGAFIYMQPAFDAIQGVLATRVGYMGGDVPNPRLEDVLEGYTGHHLVVEVTSDPTRMPYARLLDYYLQFIDPTNLSGQFCDSGPMFAPVVFYEGDAQKQAAFASRAAIAQARNSPQIEELPIREAETFFPAAEEYQAYYKKNPLRYNFKRQQCGVGAQQQK